MESKPLIRQLNQILHVLAPYTKKNDGFLYDRTFVTLPRTNFEHKYLRGEEKKREEGINDTDTLRSLWTSLTYCGALSM